MSPDPNAGSVRPPSGGSGGDQAAAARFEIVLRGYDRRQVEEHISTLERTIAQQRDELEKARSGVSSAAETSVFTPAAKKPSSGSGLNPEMISSFTTRLQSILQAAEEEAEEVRSNARAFAQAEEQSSRARLDELERRRQAVLSELGRVRTQLEGLLTSSAASPASGSGASGAGASGASAKAADQSKEGSAKATEAVRPEPPRPVSPAAPAPAAPAPAGRAPSGPGPSGPGSGMRPEPPRPPGGQSIGGRPGGGYGQPGSPHPAVSRPTGPPPGTGRPGGPLPMRPGQAPQPSAQGPGQPGSPQPPPQPKPRPTPRPRPGATNLPGVEITQGPVESGNRNGNTRSDDDGGFGSGAR